MDHTETPTEDGQPLAPPLTHSSNETRIDNLRDFYSERVKIKRTRRPWIYKEKYDWLLFKYRVVKWLCLAGWIAFLIALRIAI